MCSKLVATHTSVAPALDAHSYEFAHVRAPQFAKCTPKCADAATYQEKAFIPKPAKYSQVSVRKETLNSRFFKGSLEFPPLYIKG